jgi:hypothetical protein
LTVLAGSAVCIDVESVNGKRLGEVWLEAKTAASQRRFALSRRDEAGLKWELSPREPPLAAVVEDVFFEVQVVDEDNLSLDVPISGRIVVRAEPPPSMAVRGRRNGYLPANRREIEYRLADSQFLDLDAGDGDGVARDEQRAPRGGAAGDRELVVRRQVRQAAVPPGRSPRGDDAPGKGEGQGGGGGRTGRQESDGAAGLNQPPAVAADAARDRGDDDAPAALLLGQESWFAELPAEVRQALQSGTRRPPPRGYEERLRRYFESIDE